MLQPNIVLQFVYEIVVIIFNTNATDVAQYRYVTMAYRNSPRINWCQLASVLILHDN